MFGPTKLAMLDQIAWHRVLSKGNMVAWDDSTSWAAWDCVAGWAESSSMAACSPRQYNCMGCPGQPVSRVVQLR